MISLHDFVVVRLFLCCLDLSSAPVRLSLCFVCLRVHIVSFGHNDTQCEIWANFVAFLECAHELQNSIPIELQKRVIEGRMMETYARYASDLKERGLWTDFIAAEDSVGRRKDVSFFERAWRTLEVLKALFKSLENVAELGLSLDEAIIAVKRMIWWRNIIEKGAAYTRQYRSEKDMPENYSGPLEWAVWENVCVRGWPSYAEKLERVGLTSNYCEQLWRNPSSIQRAPEADAEPLRCSPGIRPREVTTIQDDVDDNHRWASFLIEKHCGQNGLVRDARSLLDSLSLSLNCSFDNGEARVTVKCLCRTHTDYTSSRGPPVDLPAKLLKTVVLDNQRLFLRRCGESNSMAYEKYFEISASGGYTLEHLLRCVKIMESEFYSSWLDSVDPATHGDVSKRAIINDIRLTTDSKGNTILLEWLDFN